MDIDQASAVLTGALEFSRAQGIVALRCAAEALASECRMADAVSALRRAEVLASQEGATDSLKDVLCDLGELYDAQADSEAFHEVLGRLEGMNGHSALYVRLGDNIERLAGEAFESGKLSEAERLIGFSERALRKLTFTGVKPTELARPTWVPDLYERLGKLEKAESVLRDRIRVARGGDDKFELATDLMDLGYYLRRRGRLEESARLITEASNTWAEAARDLYCKPGPKPCKE